MAMRIEQHKSQSNALNNENRGLQSSIHQLQNEIIQNSSAKYNQILSLNARLESELHELESRLNIVQKDSERLEQVNASRTVKHVNYTVVDGRINMLKQQLEALLSENTALVNEVKNTPPLVMPEF